MGVVQALLPIWAEMLGARRHAGAVRLHEPCPLMAVDPQFSPVPLRHMLGNGQAGAAGTT